MEHTALNARQRRFVAEYLKDRNATQAAIRAGYKAANADVVGPRLLGHVGIASAIDAGETRLLAKAELTAASTLEAIRRQVDGDVRHLFDEHGNLRPIASLSAEDAALIAGFEVIVKNAAAGDGHTDTVHKVKLKDQSRYVEMAAKHFSLLTEKVELHVTVELLSRLDIGRQRNAELSPSCPP